MSPHRSSRSRAVSAASVLLLLAATPAFAEATPQEAARLQAIGETYFGKPAAGEPSVVTVVVEGDHYRAGLDLGLVVRRFVALAPDARTAGFTLDWGPMTTALAPAENGLWRFWDQRMPKLTARVESQTTEVTNEGLVSEGLFDPLTGASPSFKGRFARLSATSTVKKPDQAVRVGSESTYTDLAYEGTARPAGEPGVVDVAMRQTVGTLAYSIEISEGTAAGIPDMKIEMTTGRHDTAIGIHGLRHSALLDLWAHLVAHHAPSDFTDGQGALKAKLAAALPLLGDVTQKVSIADIGLQSPFAIVKASKGTVDFDAAGLTRDGHFSLRLGAEGLQIYSLFMPKWAAKLVPSDLAIAGRVTGYDLATPLSAFLDTADFAAPKPLTPEQEARIAPLFLPRGNVEIVLDGNRIGGSLYAITVDGRLTAGPGGAKGAVTVKAKGLDKVADLLATPDADAQAKTLGAMIAQARQLAERKGDDHVWRFDFEGDKVAVNGQPLK